MKKQIVLLASVLLFATTAFATTMSKPPAKTNQSQTKAPANNVLTQQQSTYTLRLNSNPTTGYSWFLVSYPKKLLTFVGHKYIAPNKHMMGASGQEVWQFKATPAAFIAPRILKIKLLYARPWEVKDLSAAQTFYIVTK